MASAMALYDSRNCSYEVFSAKPVLTLLEGGLQKPVKVPVRAKARSKATPATFARAQAKPAPQIQRRSGAAILLAAALISIAICVFSMVASHVAASKLANDLATVSCDEYVVCKGDSLWAIASDNPIEGHSTSDVVTWIRERNNLESGLIIPGQRLVVPSRAS